MIQLITISSRLHCRIHIIPIEADIMNPMFKFEELDFNSFCVRVALFKHDFLRDAFTESLTSCAQIKAKYLRISELPLLSSIDASKME